MNLVRLGIARRLCRLDSPEPAARTARRRRRRPASRSARRTRAASAITKTGEVTDGGQRAGFVRVAGAHHLHGAVPDVGPDDVGLPDAGHGDGEGEQGRRSPARLPPVPIRFWPASCSASAPPDCCRSRCGYSLLMVGGIGIVPMLMSVAGADAVAVAGAGHPALPRRVPVLRQPHARHRVARFEHA